MKKGRVLAIGDVHGCLKALKKLLKWVEPHKEDTVVMLGDYIDRGPQSKEVIDYLLNWKWKAKLVTLKGNHEYLMEQALLSKIQMKAWRQVGGDDTLDSYGGQLSMVPESHWDFIKKAKPFYETEEFIFVHGGLEPKKPLEDQDPEEISWMRFRDARAHCSGKTVICGHTVQREGLPVNKGFAICVDTAICRGSWLTCLDASSGFFWQISGKGAARMRSLKKISGES